MFPVIMSLLGVRRLRVLKFLWLENSWIQRKVPPLAPLCTKANNIRKPVRYTKKAKPKTIIDIARLLQQKTKETKKRKQSVISAAPLKAASSTSKHPNQLNYQIDAKTTKVQTSTSTLPAKVTVEGSPEDTKPVLCITDVEAALNVASRTFCEPAAPDAAIIDSAVDFPYSKCVDQVAMGGLDNKTYTDVSNGEDAAPKAVDSSVELPTNAQQEPPTQDMTPYISPDYEPSSANTKGSSEDVVSTSKKPTPDVVVVSEDIVNMPEVMVTSKVPEVSSDREDGHLEESFSDSEVVTVTNASTFVNIVQARYSSQPQSTPSQDFIAPSWSSNVNADKTPSNQETISQAVDSFPVGTAESVMDISGAEDEAVSCAEVPTLQNFCYEEAIPVSDPIPEVSLFKSTEDLPAVETISASLSEAVKENGMSEMSGDAQSSINLKDPILAQTDILEDEVQKAAFEELPEAQLDPIKRLFLNKIQEYTKKSKASGGLVDAGPEYEKVFNEELSKLQRLYEGGDLSKFPEFNFSEPALDESSSK